MNKYLSNIQKELKNDDWYRMVFLGDSITSTEWVYPNWRGIMEFVLKETMEDITKDWEACWWRIRCYNSGFNGMPTKEMIKCVDDEIKPHRPDLIVFMDTYNDKYRDISSEKHKENLDVIFRKLLEISQDVVFTSSVARMKKEANEENRKYMDAANEAVEKYKDKILSIDLFDEYGKLDLKRFYTFISVNGNEDAGIEPGGVDFGHPNQLGNAYIAKILLKKIFGIDFDPELYIKDTLAGKKYPEY